MTPKGEYRLEDLPPELVAQILVNPVTGCWEWQHNTGPDPFRYGYVRWEGRYQPVYRVVYRLLVGEIPADRPHIDHVYAWGCRSRACCWPAHLEPVTPGENSHRGMRANLSKGVARRVLDRVAAGTGTEEDLALAATAHIPPPRRLRKVSDPAPSGLEPLYTAEQAAAILGVTADVMDALRKHHTGPRCFRVPGNKTFFYRQATVLAWRGQVPDWPYVPV
jgi:hypothetical protein